MVTSAVSSSSTERQEDFVTGDGGAGDLYCVKGHHSAEPLLPLGRAAPALALTARWVEGIILCKTWLWSSFLRFTVIPPLSSLLPL